MAEAIINSKIRTEFECSPLFFMRVKSSEDEKIPDYWESAASQIICIIEDKEMLIDGGLKLMIADYPFRISKIQSKKDESSKDNMRLSYQVHPFSPSLYYDVWFLIRSVLTRKQNEKDNFYFQELLWALDNHKFDEDVITLVLSEYNTFYVSEILNVFQEVGHCLSYEKQEKIAGYLKKWNVNYKLYFPHILSEALRISDKRVQRVGNKRNLFELLSLLLGYDSLDEKTGEQYTPYGMDTLRSSSNDIVRFFYWLKNDDYDYGDLAPIAKLFSLLKPQIQLDVVKRYFHAIRLGQAVYSDKMLTAFLNNRYKKFERFCNVLTANLSPMDMTVPLLCDNIQCFIKSNGKSFQSFNGVLDRTFMNANPIYLEMNFMLDKILPKCDGGAVYNNNFIGFINYRLAGQLAEEKFEVNSLEQNIINILNIVGTRAQYHAEGEKEDRFNKWKIYDAQYKTLLANVLGVPSISSSHDPLDVDLTSFRERLITYFNRKLESQDGKWLFTPEFYKDYLVLVQAFCNISTVRIFIRKDVVVGRNILVPIKGLVADNVSKRREVEITMERVKEALEHITGTEMKDNVLEFPYDPIKLGRLCKIFYYRMDETEGNIEKLHFLTERKLGKYPIYCAPEYENEVNDVTNLPYFWCQRKECFRNVLSNQVLANTKSWKEYTLFHMLEICGFPLLKETVAGFEPNSVIRNIIAIANKVKNFFEKLKCEACGHLIWAEKSGAFNNYNRFVCINNLCPEYKKEVYLSYCNRCKKEIIDSRHSVQCPNGWWICPSCCGCCNNEIIESVVQRLVVSHKAIPSRIERQRGNGHNDKGIYFCPKCGNKMIGTFDKERDDIIYQCEDCDYLISKSKMEKWHHARRTP